jgi:hypothetical protein
MIKMQTAIVAAGSWIPRDADLAVTIWLNAWMGPQWIVVPDTAGIEISTAGGVAFVGPLNDLPNSPLALNHMVVIKQMDGEHINALFRLADELEDLLQAVTPSVDAYGLQRQVREFFVATLKPSS